LSNVTIKNFKICKLWWNRFCHSGNQIGDVQNWRKSQFNSTPHLDCMFLPNQLTICDFSEYNWWCSPSIIICDKKLVMKVQIINIHWRKSEIELHSHFKIIKLVMKVQFFRNFEDLANFLRWTLSIFSEILRTLQIF